ncbi:helix-turn-helix domain-containing protein [Rhodovulum steppense]|uniref:Excisionase family DNA binding protein n=1 Tax=Rhodovulum steppense TaxID=540251 RepID=A0A4R1YHV7_9RHOB|nr:helix-turn-helix domain-containing protein [Rhodovulum steppense]TCM75889.1 excisionase family DNA binding protein [Rhodovulum steppense]
MQRLAEQYLTVADVADRWQLGARTVRNMVRDGALPAERLNREHRIRAAEMWACERGPFPRGAAQARALAPLMTVCDVAALVRVDVRTVERWLGEGLPTRNVGTNVRIDEDSARAWILAHKGLTLPPFEAPEEPRRRLRAGRSKGGRA